MRHHDATKKLSRESKQRKALVFSLARGLVLADKITTTEARAKAIRPYVERIVSYGKKADASSIKRVYAMIGEEAGKKMVKEIAPKYSARTGGYTRIMKTDNRKGDGSKMSIIEFV